MSNSEIIIPDPKWGSKLYNIILSLEKLRTKGLRGELPVHIFFQLKNIFQMLETLGSARIEGNNTTLSEHVEKILEEKTKKEDDKQNEIKNIERAIEFIEENTDENTKFDRAYISELHKILVKDLTPPPEGEGSRYPGALRMHNVKIEKSDHTPPSSIVLEDYFEALIKFINNEHEEQYQLLMIAIAHHRFAYIHPFDNGNGRMGRLLNYALLIKLGFQVKDGRIINPSSVFYTDRNKYYNMLSKADSLKDNDILNWSEYFLLGLKNEIEKIDSLLSREYVKNKILLPAITFSFERKIITEKEYKILQYIINKDDMLIKAEELDKFGIKESFRKSEVIAKLRQKKIVHPIKQGGRIYTISFIDNYLLRGVVQSLTEEGFVSNFLNKN